MGIQLRISSVAMLLATITMFCALFMDVQAQFRKPAWVAEKKHHAIRRLSSAGYKKLCKPSNPRKHRVSTHLDNILKPRVPDTPGHTAVADYIVGILKNMGYDVEEHMFRQFTPYGTKSFRNIIGRADPNAQRYLTLVCHYDSKDCTAGYCQGSGKFQFLGAIDSAVPCSVILTVAATLRPYMSSAKNVSLQLLFLDGEEAFQRWTSTDSLYGARQLAKKWSAEPVYDLTLGESYDHLDKIDFFVLLDLLGTNDTYVGDSTTHVYNQNGNPFLELPVIERKLASANCLKRRQRIFSSHRAGFTEDDHVPFQQRGVNVMHLISSPFPRVWHTQHDNRASLDPDTVTDLEAIMRVFTAEYLNLRI